MAYKMDAVIDLTDLEVEVEGVTGEFPHLTAVWYSVNGKDHDILPLIHKSLREELLTDFITEARQAERDALVDDAILANKELRAA